MKNVESPQQSGPEGFLLINKPQDATSFRCIAQIRRILGNKKLKAGYAGTLDPFASGLLMVGIGRSATRLLHIITRWDKRYIARAKLGQLTDTLDLTGQTAIETETHVTQQQLTDAIKELGTQYKQIPPLYSALKHEGLPLYKLARKKGKTAQDLEEVLLKKARTVSLHHLELLKFDPPFFTIETAVSHGTYIRTLVNDIAQKAGTFATAYELSRTKIGNLSLEDAINLDDLKTPEDIEKNLISVEEFLAKHQIN